MGKRGPCHFVETRNFSFLLDCGEGAAGALKSLGMLNDFHDVFITHLHPDHISGFLPLLQNMFLVGRKDELRVYLPKEGLNLFNTMMDLAYLSPAHSPYKRMEVNLAPLSEGMVKTIYDVSIRSWFSDHFVHDNKWRRRQRSAFGFTIDDGASRLVYTGDVSSVNCFESEMIQGSILLCEAMHIEWDKVKNLAEDRQLSRVIFTHVSPDRQQELEHFCADSPLLIPAQDGQEFDW